ncbi:MAG: ABC transporter ATP-binding protein [Polyangiaceae bacterium]|nr:ABC transporter ATP-binding protein [Polyangiaceae bacterium]
MAALLEASDLVTSFQTPNGWVRAVDGVSFDVREREVVAIVGESGSGKSVTSLSVLRLLPFEGAKTEGSVRFRGQELLSLSEREMCKVRGGGIAMVFQEPMSSLNPVFTIGSQISEAVRLHHKVSRKEARAKALELLKLVNIPAPDTNIDSYPHQLSGGMRQRAMIAMALGAGPKLLIADEPTTALDVTVQAQVLDLLLRLRDELGLSVMLITHDLGVVAEYADRVLVMYAGQIVEEGSVREVFAQPSHPYTRGLLRSLPDFSAGATERPRRLPTIPGMVPPLSALPKGCRFSDRCEFVRDECEKEVPSLRTVVSQGAVPHRARCILVPESSGTESSGTEGTVKA